jgi:site-specific recombinase XerC
VGHFASRTRRPPTTLTDDEIKRLLRASGAHRDGFRDHVIYSLALGCGLRESEIVALDVADVVTPAGGVRRVIQLRRFKGSGRPGADRTAQRVHLPESTYYKLEKYIRPAWRRRPDWPLFMSRKGNRLSERAVRAAFATWQRRAGFDHLYNFHALRHTAVSVVRRRTKDIRIAQLFARHAHLRTTLIYDHPSDEERAAAVRGLAV